MLKNLIMASLVIFSMSASAIDVFKADKYFLEKKYDLAKIEYEAATKVGSPQAYYQLGAIFFKGLGETKQDLIKALVYFSLASEYHLSDSSAVVEIIIKALPENKQAEARTFATYYKKNFGKEAIERKYFPITIPENLDKKIMFGDNFKTDIILDDYTFELETQDEFNNDEFTNDTDDEFTDSEEITSAFNTTNTLARRAVMTVIDLDIAPDGSMRNPITIYNMGDKKNTLYNISISNIQAPSFDEKNVSFIHRNTTGIASYDKFEMKQKHPDLFSRLKRIANKNKAKNTARGKYQYAMSLMLFKFIAQEENEAVSYLKESAMLGYPQAQYEYGLYLYREQKDIEQGIKWIAKASQYGLTKAEYRPATILKESPWVENDEFKAIFWYEQAAQKEDVAAALKVAEIKLMSKNEKVFDVQGAITHLKNIPEKEKNNPEYHYLQAMSHIKMQPRKLSHAVNFIREAINLGEDLNWDVSKWEAQLANWTKGGKVFVTDM